MDFPLDISSYGCNHIDFNALAWCMQTTETVDRFQCSQLSLTAHNDRDAHLGLPAKEHSKRTERTRQRTMHLPVFDKSPHRNTC